MSYDGHFQIPDSSGSCLNSYVKVLSQKSEKPKPPLKTSSANTCWTKGLVCLPFSFQVWSGRGQHPDDLLSTGCGSTVPSPIVAPYNIISSRFQSSGAPGAGFMAYFSSSKNEPTGAHKNTRTYQLFPEETLLILMQFCSSGCGANFTAPSGRVVSPNYPADYPHFSNCNYTISAVQAVLVLTFKTFEVEGKLKLERQNTLPVKCLDTPMFLFYLLYFLHFRQILKTSKYEQIY